MDLTVCHYCWGVMVAVGEEVEESSNEEKEDEDEPTKEDETMEQDDKSQMKEGDMKDEELEAELAKAAKKYMRKSKPIAKRMKKKGMTLRW